MTLKYIFSVLKDEARFTVNPWESVKRKKNHPNTRRDLTIDELKKVCQSATGELRVLLCIGLYSGLRLGIAARCAGAKRTCAAIKFAECRTRPPEKNSETITIPIHPALRAMLTEIPPMNAVSLSCPRQRTFT